MVDLSASVTPASAPAPVAAAAPVGTAN